MTACCFIEGLKVKKCGSNNYEEMTSIKFANCTQDTCSLDKTKKFKLEYTFTPETETDVVNIESSFRLYSDFAFTQYTQNTYPCRKIPLVAFQKKKCHPWEDCDTMTSTCNIKPQQKILFSNFLDLKDMFFNSWFNQYYMEFNLIFDNKQMLCFDIPVNIIDSSTSSKMWKKKKV